MKRRFTVGLSLLACLCLPGSGPSGLARAQEADPATSSFNAATEAFYAASYAWAEEEFSKLIQQHPDSPRILEAVLLQAQARFHQKRYDGVVELLNRWMEKSGALQDAYQYWLAQAHSERGEYERAASVYGQVLQSFPESAFRLNAAYGQAYAHFKLGEIDKTIALLREPSGAFQQLSQSSTNQVLAGNGYLLLGEALRARQDYRAAEAALEQLASQNPGAELKWNGEYLLARIELADRRSEAALQRATNLLQLARSTAQPTLVEQSLRLQAQILESSRPLEAAAVYEEITQIAGLSPEVHRQSLLKIIDLAATANQVTNAIARLESFLGSHPQDVALDLLTLTLGELHLKQFRLARPAAAGTNRLAQARVQFDRIIQGYTNSTYVGRAQMNRGWTFWEEARLLNRTESFSEAEKAFHASAQLLPQSEEQALARFKRADCQFELDQWQAALEGYSGLIEQYGSVTRVREQWFEPGLYQAMRAAIQLERMDAAREYLRTLLEWFPEGETADNALLVFAEAQLAGGEAEEARRTVQRLEERYSKSALLPESKLLVARSYLGEQQWKAAIDVYDRWVEIFTNNPSRAQVEFDRAWAHYQAGQGTNAYLLFTNLISAYPTNRIAPLAQYWVADYHFQQKEYAAAELAYQSKVILDQAVPGLPDLPFEARSMAGLAAFKREGYANARGYLTNLVNDPRCPERLVPEAYFRLGNVFIEEGNFDLALNSFNPIINRHSQHWLAPMAWGRIGDCHFQLAIADPKRYDEAGGAYRKVIDAPGADIAVRSQAEVGLGLVLEKQANLKEGTERAALLNQALIHYQNVVFGRRLRPELGETSSPFWLKEAGLAAGRVAESLNRIKEAVGIYRRLQELVPAMGPALEQRLARLIKESEGR